MKKGFAYLLEKNNKTAYQVSKDTGIPLSTLSDWKNGKSTPSLDKVALIANYFDVDVSYFVKVID